MSLCLSLFTPELSELDDQPLEPCDLDIRPLSLSIDEPLVRPLGSFSLFSERPMFWPNCADESLLLLPTLLNPVTTMN